MFRLNRSVAPLETVIVVKLKIPLVGRFNVMLLVALSGPSAPVLPELNCATATEGLMMQSIIASLAMCFGFITFPFLNVSIESVS